MPFLDVIRKNLPSNKPQLWENLPRAITRRIQIELMTRLDDGWAASLRRATLTGCGLSMDVSVLDSIGRSIYVYGAYELCLTRFLKSTLQPGGVFVDVGANAGYHTLIAASIVGDSGRVLSFEPSPGMRERLARNVARNRLGNVVVRQEAIWSGVSQVTFHESTDPGNTGTSSVLPGHGREQVGVTVSATTLDDVSASLGRPIDVVKVDVEGGEGHVFTGARALLASVSPPVLAFESFDLPSVLPLLKTWEIGRLSYDTTSGFHVRPADSNNPRDPFAAYEAPTFVAVKPSASQSLAQVARRFAAK